MKASVEIVSSYKTGEKSIVITSRASFSNRAYGEVDKIRECLTQMNYKVKSSCISSCILVNGVYRKAIVSVSIPDNMLGNLKQMKEDIQAGLGKVN